MSQLYQAVIQFLVDYRPNKLDCAYLQSELARKMTNGGAADWQNGATPEDSAIGLSRVVPVGLKLAVQKANPRLVGFHIAYGVIGNTIVNRNWDASQRSNSAVNRGYANSIDADKRFAAGVKGIANDRNAHAGWRRRSRADTRKDIRGQAASDFE